MADKETYASLKKETVSNPDDYETWLDLGDYLLNEENNPKEAIEAYKKANDLLPTADFRLRIGHAYAVMGDFNTAITMIKEKIEDNPNAYAYNILASVYIMMEDLSNARLLCQKSLEYDSEYEETYYLLGSIAKSKQKAITYYKKAIELDPEYAIAWRELGKKFIESNWNNLAIRALEKAVEINDSDIWSRLFLANAYWRAGKNVDADHLYQVLIQQNPDDEQIKKWYSDFLNSTK